MSPARRSFRTASWILASGSLGALPVAAAISSADGVCGDGRPADADALTGRGGMCRAPAAAAAPPPGIALVQRGFRRSEWSEKPVQSVEAEDIDCNGDGLPDCGRWDYSEGRCENRVYCGHYFRSGDWTLGDSCRCRRCSGPFFKGKAFGDTALVNPDGHPFDALWWGTFRTWAGHVDSCAPWLMPKNDEALKSALSYARSRRYKVRIAGAGHSAGGLVTDGSDANVMVLSLGDYTAAGEWEFGLHDMPDGSKLATVNAGWTFAHLYEKIRPLGYFLPSQTAGYFFSIGGVVANSVHGGGYATGFLHSYTTRMRVMSYNGTVRIVETEEELRYWRNSMGLLGIILGVELQLERRERHVMYTITRQLEHWSLAEFWSFIKHDAEANVPSDITQEGGASTRAAASGDFFVNFIDDPDHPTAIAVVQKVNENVDPEYGIPRHAAEQYAEILKRRVRDDWHGIMSWGEAARRDGAPPLRRLGIDMSDLLHAAPLPLAKRLANLSIQDVPRLVKQASETTSDGFYLTEAPAMLASAYFLKPEKAFEAMDYLRQMQIRSLDSKDFAWNMPGEFRFVKVQDSAVLQPVPPGLWFAVEMSSLKELARNDQSWKRAFKQVQDYWVYVLGAKPHLGKLWGFETQSFGVIEPFGETYTRCSVFAEEQKKSFDAYRTSQDPAGVFASGLGMSLLAVC